MLSYLQAIMLRHDVIIPAVKKSARKCKPLMRERVLPWYKGRRKERGDTSKAGRNIFQTFFVDFSHEINEKTLKWTKIVIKRNNFLTSFWVHAAPESWSKYTTNKDWKIKIIFKYYFDQKVSNFLLNLISKNFIFKNNFFRKFKFWMTQLFCLKLSCSILD